jgi:hypothetical protein
VAGRRMGRRKVVEFVLAVVGEVIGLIFGVKLYR